MEPVRFGPERIALVPVLITLFSAIPLALSSPLLTWVFLLPVAAGVWVLRARVVADAQGLEVCNGLGVHRHPWDDVEGLDVPRRGPVRLLLRGGSRPPLTALPRRDVRRLLAVAPGRTAGGAAGS